ncbi:MAG: riboflavin biosynthesis protein RibF [Candidatus Omnitrophota bacterium]
MRVIHDLNDIRRVSNAVVAIGVFDGVHRAHRTIIKAAIERARRIGGSAVVVTFWPHPRGQESVYSLEHRLRLFEQLGVGLCVVLPFTRSFARLSPEAFANKIICGCLKARAVYVGGNFRFGRGAAGDASDLSRLLKPCGVTVRVFKMLKTHGTIVSSSYIRQLISRGKLAAARKLLMRPVSVYGHVVHGTGRGTRLGFPTANIDPHHEISPPSGIYAVRVLFNGTKAKGICYIGTRPTFRRSNACPSIEVHILRFKKSLYGKYLEAQFIKKIRNDKAFESPEALVGQIKRDIIKAKKILS